MEKDENLMKAKSRVKKTFVIIVDQCSRSKIDIKLKNQIQFTTKYPFLTKITY